MDQLKALSIPTYLAPAANTLDDSYKEITVDRSPPRVTLIGAIPR